MKTLVFGTTNQAKVDQVSSILASLGITVRGLLPSEVIHVEETGETPVENAVIKAIAYANHLNTTVLSMDNALRFEGLPEHEQPWTTLRRGDDGKPLSDEAMLAKHAKLISRYGGALRGVWSFGLCVATPFGPIGETTICSPREFRGTPCAKMVKGYPLESIQVDPLTQKYIAEMSEEERNEFWNRTIGVPLREFIRILKL